MRVVLTALERWPENEYEGTLSLVTLVNVRFFEASLRGVDLRGARLDAVDFSYADLREANLEGSVERECEWLEATR